MNRSTLLLIGSLVLLPTNANADMLRASRYIQRVQASNGGFAIAVLPRGVLANYCGDSDGCKLSLKLADGFGLEARSTRLYLDETDASKWLGESSPTAGLHLDADGNIDTVLNLWLGLSNCGFADLDAGGADGAAGFTLGVVAGAGITVTCTLVLED